MTITARLNRCKKSATPSGTVAMDTPYMLSFTLIQHKLYLSRCRQMFKHLTWPPASTVLNTNLDTVFYRSHDDAIKWKHFPRFWPFVRKIHRSPVDSPHKGQWTRAFQNYVAKVYHVRNQSQRVKVRVRVRNFIRQHQSSSYTHKKSISFTVKYLYSIRYTWLSTEQFTIMPCSSNSNCDVVRGPH